MKKVINNKVYDTEAAKLLGSSNNGHRPNDFDYYEESLYRTKSGNYFLHGEGGANSRYGVWHGNSGGPGEKIMPMSYSEATEWAQKNLDGDSYIRLFGNPGDGEAKVTVTLSAAAKNRLDRMVAESGENLSATVERLIMGEPAASKE